MNKLVPAALILATATSFALGSDWAQWRGPGGTGYVAEANPPIEWSESKNIRWKTTIPGKGYSSPVIWGEHIYLMTAVEAPDPQAQPADEAAEQEGQDQGRGGRGGRGRGPAAPTSKFKFMVLAINRADGGTAWTTTVREEVPHEGAHPTATFASPSAVTDGKRIFANFGSRGLYCLDMRGNIAWETDLGDMQTRNSFGEGASPALHGETLVVPWDHEGGSFVAALNAATGSEKWRVSRDEPTTWATPVVAEVNGRTQVILPGTNHCVSYDLETGEEVWRSRGLTANVIPTPIVAHGMVYLISGFRGSALLAVDLARATGDITETDAIVWTHDRATPYVPSPMLAGRNLYFLGSNNGILSCFDAKTGEAHYAGQRLEGVQNVYSSIVGAGNYLYVCGREGEVAVIANSPEFRQVATNTLGEGINASPAIVGDEIYLRGDVHLYCIGTPR